MNKQRGMVGVEFLVVAVACIGLWLGIHWLGSVQLEVSFAQLQVAQQAHLATHFKDANYPLLQTEAALEQYLYAHTALNTIQHEALEHPAPIAVGAVALRELEQLTLSPQRLQRTQLASQLEHRLFPKLTWRNQAVLAVGTGAAYEAKAVQARIEQSSQLWQQAYQQSRDLALKTSAALQPMDTVWGRGEVLVNWQPNGQNELPKFLQQRSSP